MSEDIKPIPPQEEPDPTATRPGSTEPPPPPGYPPPQNFPVQGPPPGYPAQSGPVQGPPPSGQRFGRFKRPQSPPPYQGFQGPPPSYPAQSGPVQSPPPGYGQPRRAAPTIQPEAVKAQLAVMQKGMATGLTRAGIDMPTALKTLMLASIIGILAGLFGWISPKHTLILAGVAIALNGFTYSFFKGKEDLAGGIMSVVAGIVTVIFWLILTAIAGNDYTHTNFLITMFFKLVFGLISFGWLALLRALPPDLFATVGAVPPASDSETKSED